MSDVYLKLTWTNNGIIHTRMVHAGKIEDRSIINAAEIKVDETTVARLDMDSSRNTGFCACPTCIRCGCGDWARHHAAQEYVRP